MEGFMMRRVIALLAVCALIVNAGYGSGRKDVKTAKAAKVGL